ncbi:MAG: response regulator transcription factor [Bacteroidota bacterium]
MKPINILLADSAFLVREGIKAVISGYPYMNIVGEATHTEQLSASISKGHPTLVIIDYNSPGSFSTEDIEFILTTSPELKVLVISSNLKKEEVFRVLEYGAKGFLLKECDHTEIIGAIHALSRNEKFFCGKVLDIILERKISPSPLEACAPARLTGRETEIVKLMAEGMATQDIAELLSLSVHTVYTHRKNVMRKLGATNAAEVILYAINTSLVDSRGKSTLN